MEKLDLAELAREGRAVVERVHELSEEAIRIAKSGTKEEAANLIQGFEFGIAPCVELFKVALQCRNKPVFEYAAAVTMPIEWPRLLKWAIWENRGDVIVWLIEGFNISDEDVKDMLLEVANEKWFDKDSEELNVLGNNNPPLPYARKARKVLIEGNGRIGSGISLKQEDLHTLKAICSVGILKHLISFIENITIGNLPVVDMLEWSIKGGTAKEFKQYIVGLGDESDILDIFKTAVRYQDFELQGWLLSTLDIPDKDVKNILNEVSKEIKLN